MVVDAELVPFLEWLLPGANGWGKLIDFIFMIALGSLVGVFISYLLAVTRHGFIEGFFVVAEVIVKSVPDFVFISPRRIMAMSTLAIQEAVRRRVLIAFAVFVLLLLFAGWFLDAKSDHPARLYLSFVLTSTNYLILILTLFISTFSLPNDIKNRTIYTVVTKPVRSSEIVLGRIIGFSVVGTGLLVLMCLVSYVFVIRGVSHVHTVVAENVKLSEDRKSWEGETSFEDHHRHTFTVNAEDGIGETDTLMGHWHVVEKVGDDFVVLKPKGDLQAKVPVYGKLRFLNRTGGTGRGVSVGHEWNYRRYIEGGSLAAAVWTFDGISREEFPDGLPVDLTLRVFRTHKGDIKNTVLGTIAVRNPKTLTFSTPLNFRVHEFETDSQFIPRKLTTIGPDGSTVEEIDLYDDLVTEDGRVEIWVRCAEQAQYFGMAQGDVYLNAPAKPFFSNFVKGYASIWLQMVIVTCFGVMFSTFLSGAIAMLATFSTIVMGYFNNFIAGVFAGVFESNELLVRSLGTVPGTEDNITGGGPIESLIRLLTQKNLSTDLDLGDALLTAIQWTDVVLMALLWLVTNIMPDFRQFNTSPHVAYGYNISTNLMGQQSLTTLGFFLILVVVSYYFLKNARDRGMNQNFVRKVVYIGLIALLLYPLYLIGQPASKSANRPDNPGGLLSQLRAKHELSQANLGEIDPASESMKLATLGMRGVAANALWTKANHYKKTENWDGLSATLNQITKLQPNFVSVWEFQSHNLAYNVSVEFDDYRLRYHWIKKGIDFLIQGTRHNSREPRLLHYVGWITGQKIGRADEHELFRELFGEDKDYHDSLEGVVEIENNPQVRGPEGNPDNWLVGRLWYLRAEDLVNNAGVVLKGKSPLVFHSDGPMSLINYAGAIEDEGYFSDTARNAWRKADAEWRVYGDKPLPSSWGVNIRLNSIVENFEKAEAKAEELDQLVPGARERLKAERYAKLTSEEKQAFETPQDQWKTNLFNAFIAATQKINVAHHEVAELASEEDKRKAKRLADEIISLEVMAERINRYRGIVNYGYWETRCEVEQTEKATTARQLIYEADRALSEAKLVIAREKYDAAWDLWADILDKYTELHDDVTADELKDQIKRYQVLLRQMDEEFPDDFKLAWMLEEGGPMEPLGEDLPGARPRITPDLPDSPATPDSPEPPKEKSEPTDEPPTPPTTGTDTIEPPPAPETPAKADSAPAKTDAPKADIEPPPAPEVNTENAEA